MGNKKYPSTFTRSMVNTWIRLKAFFYQISLGIKRQIKSTPGEVFNGNEPSSRGHWPPSPVPKYLIIDNEHDFNPLSIEDFCERMKISIQKDTSDDSSIIDRPETAQTPTNKIRE